MDNELVQLIENMETQLHEAAGETMKFIGGNNSAGTRVRKAMQNIKNLAQHVRVEVQEQKNSVTA